MYRLYCILFVILDYTLYILCAYINGVVCYSIIRYSKYTHMILTTCASMLKWWVKFLVRMWTEMKEKKMKIQGVAIGNDHFLHHNHHHYSSLFKFYGNSGNRGRKKHIVWMCLPRQKIVLMSFPLRIRVYDTHFMPKQNRTRTNFIIIFYTFASFSLFSFFYNIILNKKNSIWVYYVCWITQ